MRTDRCPDHGAPALMVSVEALPPEPMPDTQPRTVALPQTFVEAVAIARRLNDLDGEMLHSAVVLFQCECFAINDPALDDEDEMGGA